MCGANLLKICEINTKYFYKETLPQTNVLTRNTPPSPTSSQETLPQSNVLTRNTPPAPRPHKKHSPRTNIRQNERPQQWQPQLLVGPTCFSNQKREEITPFFVPTCGTIEKTGGTLKSTQDGGAPYPNCTLLQATLSAPLV